MNIDERISRLRSRHLAGRIIRNAWHEGEKTSDGYERACLLASFSPEVEEAEASEACPAKAMPPWLARLTPSLDDNVSEGVWPSVIARYVAILPKIVKLSAERLVRLDFETRAIAVREARSHATDLKVLEAIDGVLTLLDRAAAGQEVTEEEWQTARSARASATVVDAAARRSAAHAAEAAEAAAQRSVADAAWAARSAEGVAVTYEAARTASWDRMADAMLSSWEKAV